jgi:pilus assembly protein CpaE
MPGISVVIIDSDPDSITRIQGYIKNMGNHASIEGVAQSFEKGYEIIHKKRPMVVIMEVKSENLDEYLERITLILNRFPQLSIFATSTDKSADTILKVMRAGATEYLLKPVSDVDLVAALQKLGRLWVVKAPPEAQFGKIYTLFSPKGGVGNTTIAVNLAVNIYELTKEPTIIVDLDLNAGDVSTFLNIKPTYTISDVTTNISRLDKSFLKGIITMHESGIYILAEPQRVEEAISISGHDIKKVLELLKTMFKYIIIDTEPFFSERVLAAIEMSDMLVLTLVLSLPSIRNMQRYINYLLENTGYKKDRIMLLVNRYLKKGDIKIEDAEKVLGMPVKWHLPNEYITAITALNKGVPLSIYEPKSKLNLSIKEIAQQLVQIKK